MNKHYVCFITAIYGSNYQNVACQPFASQTIPTDFICFTDNKHIIANGWIIDTNTYHDTTLDIIRSVKYYKICHHKIPILQQYDIIIWIDCNIEIISKNASEIIVNKIKKNKILCCYHPLRYGQLRLDAIISSRLQKYTGQDIMKQYKEYIDDGYDDMYFKYLECLSDYKHIHHEHIGVWITNFVAFIAHDNIVKSFLDNWYDEILKHTTQDRISFSYSCYKIGIIPYTLPDKDVYGIPNMSTQLYIIHDV